MKRLAVTWNEFDVWNPRQPKKRVLLSPVFDDEESKRAAIDWMVEQLKKDPLAYCRKSFRSRIVDEPPPRHFPTLAESGFGERE